MGKQAKRKVKSEAQSDNQRRHNRATKGSNTRRRPCVWEIRQEKYKDEDGKEQIRNVKVTYPNNLLWDWSRIYDAVVDDDGVTRLMRRKADKQKPLPAPLNALLDDAWEVDLSAYAEKKGAKLERVPLGEGVVCHEVCKIQPNRFTNKPERKVLLAVTSHRRVRIPKRKGKFRKKT